MMKSKLFCFFLLFLSSYGAFAQEKVTDTVASDTLEADDEIEALFEQSISDDESSLLDELDNIFFTNVKAELRSRIIQKLQQSEGYKNG
ncbi:MAG: hypothetical protein HYZ34_05890, partial [Ignavibacteriae bacterium]|nr:hypothetical protein [Ignavibacteriota bacterium]